MKKYKSLITFLGIFVVLLALYFVMNHINKSQAERSLEESIMVTEVSGLNSMEYTDGETTMSFTKEEDEWKAADNAELNLDYDAVETIADALCQVEAVRVLSGADELSSYGLEEPAYTITMETESETEITLYIGDATDENYYATVGDKVVVYVIDSTVVDVLEFDITTLEKAEDTAEETVEETTDTEAE